MIITKLEIANMNKPGYGKSARKEQILVYLDEEFSFSLYSKEVKTLQLEEGMELNESFVQKVIEQIILPRAKQKALDLLQFRDRTEYELRRKLKENLYSEGIIETVIQYVAGYHYIDDRRYAEYYIRFKKESKSRKKIMAELSEKGIDRQILLEVSEQEYSQEEDPELAAIRKEINKASKHPGELTPEQKEKLLMKLCRKGYDLYKVKEQLNDEK